MIALVNRWDDNIVNTPSLFDRMCCLYVNDTTSYSLGFVLFNHETQTNNEAKP